MNKVLFTVLSLLSLQGCTNIQSGESPHVVGDENKAQAGEENVLPPFPDLSDPAWQPFTFDNTFEGTPMLLLPSVSKSADKSIHYVLNIRSVNGYDNLSAEGINCQDGTYKSFAFGDVINKRWIAVPKGGGWQQIGSSQYRQNQVRYALKSLFCNGLFPDSSVEIKRRLLNLSI